MTKLGSILSLALLLASSGFQLTASQSKSTIAAMHSSSTSSTYTGSSASSDSLKAKQAVKSTIQSAQRLNKKLSSPGKQAQKIASYSHSPHRNEKLTAQLYELLPLMPLELIELIIGYDYNFEEKCTTTISTPGKVNVLATLPDGTIVSGISDDDYSGIVILWKLITKTEQQPTWEPLHTFRMKDVIKALVVLHDGRLATGTAKELAIYTNKGTLSQTLSINENQLQCLAALPNNKLASGSWDHKIKIWDLASGKCERELTGHKDAVFSLLVLSNGLLLSGSKDKTIKIWDLTKEPSHECIGTLNGHNDLISSLIELPSHTIVSASFDNTIRTWNTNTGKGKQTLKTKYRYGIASLTLLHDIILSAGAFDKTIKIYRNPSPSAACNLKGHTDQVNALAILPDRKLVSGSDDKTIKVWE